MELINYRTNKAIREATSDEWVKSAQESLHDGGAGVISVEGVSCYVQGDPEKVILDLDEDFKWLESYATRSGIKLTWERSEEGEQVAYLR